VNSPLLLDSPLCRQQAAIEHEHRYDTVRQQHANDVEDGSKKRTAGAPCNQVLGAEMLAAVEKAIGVKTHPEAAVCRDLHVSLNVL